MADKNLLYNLNKKVSILVVEDNLDMLYFIENSLNLNTK